jgi:hypothetical protein
MHLQAHKQANYGCIEGTLRKNNWELLVDALNVNEPEIGSG